MGADLGNDAGWRWNMRDIRAGPRRRSGGLSGIGYASSYHFNSLNHLYPLLDLRG